VQTTIKPDDLVRTPEGRTAICLEIRPNGARLLEDVHTKTRFVMHRDQLYLVRPAAIKPWASYDGAAPGTPGSWPVYRGKP